MFHIPAHKVVPAVVVTKNGRPIMDFSHAAQIVNALFTQCPGNAARAQASIDRVAADEASRKAYAAEQARLDDEWENPHLADLPGFQDFAPQYR
jgi:hypothetical protein